jgi:hypothetical protein
MRAPEIRPVRDSYRIDTASKTEIRSFIDRCTNAAKQSICTNAAIGAITTLALARQFVPSTSVRPPLPRLRVGLDLVHHLQHVIGKLEGELDEHLVVDHCGSVGQSVDTDHVPFSWLSMK